MSSPALLLFLDLEGVLVLNEDIKRSQVEDAIRTIAIGKSRWKDFQEFWDGLFEPAAVIQLKTLHDQFELQYCLTSEWTSMMDRTAMLSLLHLSGLEFIASNLHARWETRSGQTASARRLTQNLYRSIFLVFSHDKAQIIHPRSPVRDSPAGQFCLVANRI